MAQTYSGGIRPFYGVIIRDKIKTTTNPETLKAYKTVAEDILKDAPSGQADVQDLRDAVKELDTAMAAKK
jgi:hypothetical protein